MEDSYKNKIKLKLDIYNKFWLKYNGKNQRGVSERFKVQSWKGCVGAIPPWVRIPSPLNKTGETKVSAGLIISCENEHIFF